MFYTELDSLNCGLERRHLSNIVCIKCCFTNSLKICVRGTITVFQVYWTIQLVSKSRLPTQQCYVYQCTF